MPNGAPTCERCDREEGVQTVTFERVEYSERADGTLEASRTYRDYVTLCEACYVDTYPGRSRWVETRARRLEEDEWEVVRLLGGKWGVCACASCAKSDGAASGQGKGV